MALREDMRQRVDRFSRGRTEKHWPHEYGMPGWTRAWHGYPCLHWSEMGCMPQFDTRQELDLLRTEAGELEVMLGQIRKRILQLEA